MFMTDTVDLLQKLYDWSCVDATDIDEERYLLLKKLSEVSLKLGKSVIVISNQFFSWYST